MKDVWKLGGHAFKCSITALNSRRGLLDPHLEFLSSSPLKPCHLGNTLAMQRIKHGKGALPTLSYSLMVLGVGGAACDQKRVNTDSCSCLLFSLGAWRTSRNMEMVKKRNNQEEAESGRTIKVKLVSNFENHSGYKMLHTIQDVGKG